MKILLTALIAVTALTATVSAADAHPRHKVCSYRHHHRVCYWR